MLRTKQNTAASNASSNLVPLKRVNVDAKIHSFAADVTITQVFQNSESFPIEVVYFFPVEENAAIYEFVACIDNERKIVAEIKEKQTAQQEYSQALTEGHSAYLLEQDQASNDIFTISIGALKPNSQCLITISYVTELDVLHCNKTPTIRFVVPSTIAPHYSSTHKGISSSGETNVQYVQSVPYTVDFTCQVDKLDPQVTSVTSPSHLMNIDCPDGHPITVTFTQKGIQLDRDIIVDVGLSNKRENTIAAIDSGAAMISFIPNAQDCQQNAECGTKEFIFVIDCSGSMTDDNKIGLVRKAMLLFLKSLPINCHFNIIRFGLKYDALFSNRDTAEYNEKNVRRAQAFIEGMAADRIGSELFEPLNWLKNMKRSSHCNTQIFILTDGKISNLDEVIHVCREMAEYTRIFLLCLDQSPSPALMKGLSRASNGNCNFIAPNTNVDTCVAAQLTRALQPSIENVKIKWNRNRTIRHKVPGKSPPVFFGDRLLSYALFDEKMPFDHETKVELFTNGRKEPIGVAYIDHITSTVTSKLIMRLAAKALILELLKNEKTVDKKMIVYLSMKYGILCPYTVFVGIETRLNRRRGSDIETELREVPIMIEKASYEPDTVRDTEGPLSSSKISSARHTDEDCQSMLNFSDRSYSSRDERLNGLVRSCESLATLSKRFSRTSKKRSIVSRGVDAVESMVHPVIKRLFSHSSKEQTSTTNSSYHSTSPDANASATQVLQMAWPTDVQKLVDRFIDLQQYDGLWILTDDDIKQLTRKRVTRFSSSTIEKLDIKTQQSIITTAIVIVILKNRCFCLKRLWQPLSSKASKSLQELLGKDQSRFDQLMKDIGDQLR